MFRFTPISEFTFPLDEAALRIIRRERMMMEQGMDLLISDALADSQQIEEARVAARAATGRTLGQAARAGRAARAADRALGRAAGRRLGQATRASRQARAAERLEQRISNLRARGIRNPERVIEEVDATRAEFAQKAQASRQTGATLREANELGESRRALERPADEFFDFDENVFAGVVGDDDIVGGEGLWPEGGDIFALPGEAASDASGVAAEFGTTVEATEPYAASALRTLTYSSEFIADGLSAAGEAVSGAVSAAGSAIGSGLEAVGGTLAGPVVGVGFSAVLAGNDLVSGVSNIEQDIKDHKAGAVVRDVYGTTFKLARDVGLGMLAVPGLQEVAVPIVAVSQIISWGIDLLFHHSENVPEPVKPTPTYRQVLEGTAFAKSAKNASIAIQIALGKVSNDDINVDIRKELDAELQTTAGQDFIKTVKAHTQ
jgi:hypothetical protein